MLSRGRVDQGLAYNFSLFLPYTGSINPTVSEFMCPSIDNKKKNSLWFLFHLLVAYRAILRKHREHHNASLQTGGGPTKELVLLEYERELMTVLQDEIFSGLGGEFDMDLPGK